MCININGFFFCPSMPRYGFLNILSPVDPRWYGLLFGFILEVARWSSQEDEHRWIVRSSNRHPWLLERSIYGIPSVNWNFYSQAPSDPKCPIQSRKKCAWNGSRAQKHSTFCFRDCQWNFLRSLVWLKLEQSNNCTFISSPVFRSRWISTLFD